MSYSGTMAQAATDNPRARRDIICELRALENQYRRRRQKKSRFEDLSTTELDRRVDILETITIESTHTQITEAMAQLKKTEERQPCDSVCVLQELQELTLKNFDELLSDLTDIRKDYINRKKMKQLHTDSMIKPFSVFFEPLSVNELERRITVIGTISQSNTATEIADKLEELENTKERSPTRTSEILTFLSRIKEREERRQYNLDRLNDTNSLAQFEVGGYT